MLLFSSCCGLVRDWPELNPYLVLPDIKEAGRKEASEYVQEKWFSPFFLSGLKDITNDH